MEAKYVKLTSDMNGNRKNNNNVWKMSNMNDNKNWCYM
jgi:hypothetical protein